MKKIIGIIGLASAALLAGCGGGGGDPGTQNLQVKLSMTADKHELPLNPFFWGPSDGNTAYTSRIDLYASVGKSYLRNGSIGCVLVGSSGVGYLYYLDRDDEHVDEDGLQIAFDPIDLGQHSGNAHFYFHAGDLAGEAVVRCTATDLDRPERTATQELKITVGKASGVPAKVYMTGEGPYYLGSKNNLNDLPNNTLIQVELRDDTDQLLVKKPEAANIRIRIAGGDAAEGAALLYLNQTAEFKPNNFIDVETQGGVGTFSLSSGANKGVILLEAVIDRSDNNVTNGIQHAISQRMAIPVVHGISFEPLQILTAAVEVPNGEQFAQALEVNGGTPGYAWEALSDLPSGLGLSPDGVLSGVSYARPGSYVTRIRVTDALGDSREIFLAIQIADAPLQILPVSISGMTGSNMSYVLSVSGGVPDYRWAVVSGGQMPPGLRLSSAGVISGTPTASGEYSVAVRVTDGNETEAFANISLSIEEPED